MSRGSRGPCPPCCTKGSQCARKRAKLLKDKSGAALTEIIDKETMAAPHWPALTFPDLCQEPPHITTFHLPQPASERCSPRLPVVEQRLRETEKLAHTSTSGTGQRLWRALGKSADIKAAYPSPWRLKPPAPMLETNNLERQGRRTRAFMLLGLLFHGSLWDPRHPMRTHLLSDSFIHETLPQPLLCA